MSATYTAEDLAALRRAIATGARRVEYSDGAGGSQEVEYRTQGQMLELERLMAGIVEGGGTPAGRRFHYFQHGKGLK